MDDLTAFLNARLDEDEALARQARASAWSLAGGDIFDPARVLREVEAKRKILARYGEPSADLGLGEHFHRSQQQDGLRFAVRALAAIWSDHPDYRQKWRP